MVHIKKYHKFTSFLKTGLNTSQKKTLSFITLKLILTYHVKTCLSF